MTARRDRDAMEGLDAAPAGWPGTETTAGPDPSLEATKARPAPCRLSTQDILDEQRFLGAWEQGLVPELCHYVRVRQLYRAGLVPGLHRRSR